MADMADSGTGSKLFVRQSSGLVRDVSVTNALFFNVAAFVGVGLTLYPIFYSLAFVPVWTWGPFSEYGWAAIVDGHLLRPARADLRVAHVGHAPLRRRLRVHEPHHASVPRLAGVVDARDRLGADHRLRGAARPAQPPDHGADHRHRRRRALLHRTRTRWFTDSTGGDHRARPGSSASLVVLAVIAGVVLLPTRTFHRVVTALAGFGVAALRRHVRVRPRWRRAGRTSTATCRSTRAASRPPRSPRPASRRSCRATTHDFLGDLFSHDGLPVHALDPALPVHRVPVLGVHRRRGARQRPARRPGRAARRAPDRRASPTRSTSTRSRSHLGFDMNVSWGAQLLGVQREPRRCCRWASRTSMPLLAVIANTSLWPIWALISLGGAMFPFLLCPVYINFISRMQLAWSLDRQVPEWFGEVNERLRAPAERDPRDARADRAVPLLPELQRPAALPRHDRQQAEPRRHRVVLDHDGDPHVDDAGGERAARALAPARISCATRRSARRCRGSGSAWLVFPVWIYIFAVVKPI